MRSFSSALKSFLKVSAAISVLTASALAQTADAPVVTSEVLREAGTPDDPNAGLWLSYGKSQAETRYSSLDQIDDSNAGRLGLKWTYPVGAGGGNQEGTPLFWNDTIYGITSWSVVYAVDARTGEELWRWDPLVNQTDVRPVICCGIVNRGLALYEGMIIAPIIDGRLHALDALTGRPVWESRMVYPQDSFTLTMAPRIAGDKVIMGAAGGDRWTRGRFDAFDARTGEHVWRFYTVPGDPAEGFENEAMRHAATTWGGDFYERGGGGAVWDGIAYDPEENLVYVGTGNAEPWHENFRGAQGVDNLYTCSILAVDADTGELRWYYQAVPNDNWDFDNVQQLMLLDIEIDGEMRKVVTQASKNGFFHVLDRVTGEFISAEPFVKVTWAVGHDENGRPIVHPEAYYDETGVSIYPTGGGAHNWAPMSFHPETGLVYIPSSYRPFVYGLAEELRPGSSGYARPSTENGPIREIADSIGPEAPEGANGGLQGWDPATGQLRWAVEGGGGIGGGTTTTAGNLIFQTINDGRFRALRADTGEVLYEVNVNQRGIAPPITFEMDGEQFVAFQGGMGRPANVVGKNTADQVEFPPMLYVFSLDGTELIPEPPAEPEESNGPAPEQNNGPAPEQQQN